jgi:uncharacterized protein YggU (UPF0235/DUF167 family)
MNPIEIRVHVTPGARIARIQVHQDPQLSSILKVYVTARAHDGKANQAVIQALAKHFNIPPSYLRIKRGILCREKVVLMHQV